MFQSIKPVAVPTAAASAPAKAVAFDISDSEDDLSEEEKFIASENQAANRKHKKSGGFQSMGLSHQVFKAILHKGFKVPTPIQRKCIPLVLQGLDVVGMARTGSGKTAAFLIPMLERLKSHSAKVGARALVLSPSRELAMQTQKVCKELGKHTDLRSCILVGGDSLDDQFSMIASNPDILIATPGRLLHLAVEMNLDLRSVEYVVFDEADRLFEMGFAVQLHEILSRLPQNRQTLLFSATLPKMLVDFAKAGLQEPTLIRLDADTKISKDLEMAFFSVKESEKEAALIYLLRNVIKLPKKTSHSDELHDDDDDEKKKRKKKKKHITACEADRQTIVFVATKHHVEYLANILIDIGYKTSYVYGSLDQTARTIQINRFRKGITNLLVVTDVAARGIDIPILENVINYDFSNSSKVFIHRVGRAARAGRRGWAYSLVSPAELPYVVDLGLFLSRPLIVGERQMKKEEYDYTSALIVGAFAKDSLADDVEWVRQKIAGDATLEALHRTANNAYKLYNRTKARAAAESYTRAKEILKLEAWKDMHPLLTSENSMDETERQRLDFISKLSGFRPSETIFEIGKRGTKKVEPATLIMRTRRAALGGVISATKAQAEAAHTNEIEQLTAGGNKGKDETGVDLGGDVEEDELAKAFKLPNETTAASKKGKPMLSPTEKQTLMTFALCKDNKKSHRDEEYYIHYTQKGADTEQGYAMQTNGSFVEQAGRAQLDLIGDDNDTMNQNRRNALRWDAKKKKFVKGTGIGSDNKKLIRTESGALIPATYKSGRYDEWAKKKRISIPRTGEQELSSAKQMANNNTRRFRHSADASQKRKREDGPKNELKTPEQVRKQRKVMEKRKEKNARPSKKQQKRQKRH
ncbi:P-loop containing nucleoside triphosphate hydrolase protein [Dichotomocladium elegans]|nr:P-loop containing nucleoside triphosphate hydrolase protein [Dichotomocladium elegans]